MTVDPGVPGPVDGLHRQCTAKHRHSCRISSRPPGSVRRGGRGPRRRSSGPDAPAPGSPPWLSPGQRRVAAGSLGVRRSSLPPGQGVRACPPAAAGSNRRLVRGIRGPGCARGRELQRLPLPGGEPLAGPRIVAELRAQLAVNVGMVGRVASGSGDAVECGDPDALIHRGGHDDHGWFTLFGTAAPGPG